MSSEKKHPDAVPVESHASSAGKSTSDFSRLSQRIEAFNNARNWSRFHAPKNISMALSVEASELVEIFQWMSEEESDSLDEETNARAAEEIADIQIYLLQIARRLGINIEEAVEAKMVKNAEKYPAI